MDLLLLMIHCCWLIRAQRSWWSEECRRSFRKVSAKVEKRGILRRLTSRLEGHFKSVLRLDYLCWSWYKCCFTETMTSSSPISGGSIGVSQYTLERANRTRLLIENFYAQALAHCHERDIRIRKLEEKMKAEGKIFLKCWLKKAFFCRFASFLYFSTILTIHFKVSLRRKKN